MIDVSCILINYNTSAFTIPCIQSIIDNTQEHLSYEIIVIDNASQDSDFETLKNGLRPFDSKIVKCYQSKQNLGFGGGNMLGVQYASPCKYYAFINNDTLLVSPKTLQGLSLFMQRTPDAGVCSPQMLDEHKNFRVTIDHFSSLQREILRRPLLEALFPKTYLNRKIRYQEETEVHYVQGSFMFCDAEAFHAIGGFDTNLFLYYEESDVSRRLVKRLGKKTYLVPQLEYVHYKGKSTTRSILIKIEQKISLLYYTQKHYGYFQYKTLLIYYGIRYFFSSIFKPKYWKLWLTLLKGAPLSNSLKQKQSIRN